jgi:sugar phosphate isomerase/epimerase
MASYSFNTLNHSVVFGSPPNLPEQIEAAAAAGYAHVGLDMGAVAAHDQQGLGPDALRGLMEQHGISCFELVPLMLTADREQFDVMLADLMRAVDALRPAFVYAIAQEQPDDRLVANFRRGAAALDEMGVGCAIESVAGWGVGTFDEALGLAVGAGDRVGLVLDSWQVFRTPGGWSSLAALPAERIGFVQLADGLAEPLADVGFEMANRRLLPGEGAFDLCGFRDLVLGRGYDGVVSVEVLSEEWRSRPVTDFARALLAATRALWEAPDRVSGGPSTA